jgi:hypothetical protein
VNASAPTTDIASDDLPNEQNEEQNVLPLESVEPIPAAQTEKKKHRLKDTHLTNMLNDFIKELLNVVGVQANDESWISHLRGKSQPWAAVRFI